MDRTVRATVVELQLDDPAFAAAYLEAALDESGEPDGREALLLARWHIAEAKGMAQVARAAGVQRETLYRALITSMRAAQTQTAPLRASALARTRTRVREGLAAANKASFGTPKPQREPI